MEIENLNDEELIRRYYAADEDALKMLFKRYKDNLFNFALRFCGNRADAEDAVSHTFMMVCQKKYAVKEGASFKTWAYTVARNLCLSKFRKGNKFYSLWFKKEGDDQHEVIDVADSKPSPREQLSQHEISALIQKAINRLPAEQKEALLLKEYHGFSYEEISKVLNCSLEKVKILIYRARGFLKNVIPPLVEKGN